MHAINRPGTKINSRELTHSTEPCNYTIYGAVSGRVIDEILFSPPSQGYHPTGSAAELPVADIF